MEALEVPMEIVRNPMQAMRDVDTSYSKEFVGGTLGFIAGQIAGNLVKKKSATDGLGISSVLSGGLGFILWHGLAGLVVSQDTASYVATGMVIFGGYYTASYGMPAMSTSA